MSTQPSQEASPPPVAPGGSDLPFPVVGIGASAGGLKALLTFFEHMPSGSGMAFVVVIHLSPDHESKAPEIIAGVTGMPVVQVNEAVRIERDHVYVIPPSKQLTMRGSVLEVEDFPRRERRGASIDYFFRALAAAYSDHAVAIVMSGTGADGSVGLKNIKEHGGISIVQSPGDAEYDSMPRNALGTGVVDFVLPVANMPERLLQLWQNMQRIRLPAANENDASDVATLDFEMPLRDILHVLRRRTGHDFTQYKRPTVLRRIERRLQVNQLPELQSYVQFLHQHPAETRALLKDMLISVTNFFRDKEAFEALERQAIPGLFEGKTEADQVRVWVAGCATGEEAYSIAMLLSEYAADLASPPAFQVFATDIDEDAIATARAGLYPEAIVADVSPARLRRFFVRDGGGYRVQKELRERVMFASHNLLRDPPFSRLDLVTCRNVLIYLNRDVQARVLHVFHFALRDGGLLFLGSAESADEAGSAFGMLDKSHRIFRAQPTARPPGALLPASFGSAPTPVQGIPGIAVAVKQGGFAALHVSLLEHYAAPSLVVNDTYDIVHLSDKAGRFLLFNAGEPSLNLMKVVQPELRTDLRATLYQAMQSKESVRASVTFRRGDLPVRVDLTVHPVADPAGGRTYALVIFEERSLDTAGPEPLTVQDTGSVHAQLETELLGTKQQLRTTIEQYETQHEELRASNEELQAINEELRSATEELETSKEELQSSNEELSTVNYELKTKIEEATLANNDLQNFIASTEIAVVFVDRRRHVLRYTPPAREFFNLIAGDIGRPLVDLAHRLEYPEIEADLGVVLDSLRLVEREVRSADDRWYFVRILPYKTSADRVEGAVLTFIDISSRKAAEKGMRRNEEWMRFVVDSVHDYSIITFDVDGRVNSWNAGAQRMFGFAASEIIGKSGAVLFTPEDRKAGVPQLEMKRAREDGHAADERWHIRKDGVRFYCSGVMAPLVEDKLYGYVKIARDLTTQQQAVSDRESALMQERAARAEVEELNRQKDHFLAMLSHELRNPLNLILMQAQLLLRTNPFNDGKGRHTTEIIYQTAATQARLVDDLLDVSRVMTGKLAIQQQLVPLPFIVGDSIGAVVKEAEQKQVTLDVDLTAEPLIVQADPVRVRQIAWNLLNNAIKFTPAGGRVVVSLVRDGADARLDIVDSGQGIEPEALPHIFQLFRQSDSKLTRSQGGMGIGLALVQQLVDLHGGRIEVRSEGRDRGARFTVWLPLYVVAAAQPGKPMATPVGALPQLTTSGPAGELQGLAILVVDDGADAVNAMHELLEMEGAVVESAVSGEQALGFCRTIAFDIVVSDLAMPGMDGMSLLREIHKTPLNADTPAIACSGFNRRQDVEKSLAAGFTAHLSKPIGVRELIEAIKGIARPQAARSAH